MAHKLVHMAHKSSSHIQLYFYIPVFWRLLDEQFLQTSLMTKDVSERGIHEHTTEWGQWEIHWRQSGDVDYTQMTPRWHMTTHVNIRLHDNNEIIIITKFVQKYTSYKKKIKVKKTKLTSTNSTNNKIQLMRVQQLHTLAIPMNIKKLYRHVSAVTVWQTQVTLCYLYIVMCQQWRVQCDRLR